MSLVGAWLAHAAFAAEPPAPRKTGDAVKAAAEAHARAKARVRESAEKLEAAPAPAALRKASRASGAQLEAQIQAHITAAKEQAKTYLAPFRERLELEVHYIERTCDLRGDEAAALGKQAAESGESRQQELAKALAQQAALGQLRQPRAVVMVNGNALAVPAGIGTGYFTDPAQAAREELLRVVVETLPVEAQTKLAESGRQRDQRALQSARLAVLAALDDALLLSTPQQQRMEALLDVVWDVPVATSENPFLGGPAASLGSAALLHEVRTLLPDAELPSIFRPRQLDQWKALGEAASQAQRNQPDQGGLRRGMILNRAALRPVRAGGQAAMLGEGSPSHLAVYQVSHAPAAVLELAVDDVAAACELSEDQRTKLLLAGGLDLKRMAPRPDAAAVQGAGVNLAAGLVGQVQIVKQKNRPAGRVVFQGPQGRLEADQVLMFGGLRQDKAVTASFSAYQKALGKLSDDQLQRLSVARHERRLLHQRATVAAVLHAIDERVLLSAEQHQRLSAFFKSQFAKEAGAASDDPQLETFKRLSRVSARDLEPMFDEAQWSIAAGLWQELCAAIRMPHAKPAE